MMERLTKIVRQYLVGKDQQFVFKAANEFTSCSPIEQIDLYLHIPFCKNMCPYCPYNKIEYNSELAGSYVQAMLSEIDQYYRQLGRIKVSSIYIGGGTPTNLINELGTILDRIRQRFELTGDICIETNPSDINQEVVNKLKEYGVGLVSLGVQSFKDCHLQFLGRNYKSEILLPAIELLLAAEFKSVNLDLMFTLPSQTIADIKEDLQTAIQSGVNQVTTYPLFSFPYSSVGKYRKLKRVKMPNLISRRRMYKTIHNYLLAKGFQRVSVWGFKRGNAPRYSSVTRDYYIGLGAGSASHVPGNFYINTFSVSEYIQACSSSILPLALKMEFNDLMTQYYWLYWRFYDTCIPKSQMLKIFGTDNKKLNRLLWLINFFKLSKEKDGFVVFNERGAFWLHLMQNYFSLSYINKIWSVAMETPFPDKIEI